MIYQSRKRKYRSRKEKLDRSNRFLRIMGTFALITASLLLLFRWQMVWDWLKTYFY